MAENRAEFTVRGIESADDVSRIEDELSTLDGVMGTEIDRETGEARVLYDVDILAEKRIELTVEDMGYAIESPEE